MNAKTAANWILELYRRVEPGEPYAATVSEAVSLAIWALVEQGRYED